MHILLLVIYYPPDPDPTGQLMHQVAASLVQRGHTITVVTTVADDSRDGGGLGGEDRDGVRVIRVPTLLKRRKGSLRSRGLTYASFSLLAGVLPRLGLGRPDVVLATNGGFATGLSAWFAGVGRARTVFSVQDLYPDAVVAAGRLAPGPLLTTLYRVERLMYRLADQVVVNAPAARARLVEKGTPQDKIRVISNFVDIDAIAPGPRHSDFSAQHGLDDAFVVGYSGNLGWAYDWPLVLDVAERLRDRRDLLFLLAGEGVAKTQTASSAKARGLDNVRFLPFQPRARLGALRAATDVQIVPYRPGAARSSMASKVYEIMASGRPVWASAERDTDLATLLHGEGCGLVTAPGDVNAAATALTSLADDEPTRSRMGARGRLAAEQRYGLQAAVDAWEAVLAGADAG